MRERLRRGADETVEGVAISRIELVQRGKVKIKTIEEAFSFRSSFYWLNLPWRHQPDLSLDGHKLDANRRGYVEHLPGRSEPARLLIDPENDNVAATLVSHEEA